MQVIWLLILTYFYLRVAKLLCYVEDLPTSITQKARVYQSKLYTIFI